MADGPSRLVPRTTLGIVTVLVAAVFGAALSSAILFAYYQFRVDRLEDKIENFTSRLDDTVGRARRQVRREGDEARAQIRAEMEPLQELQASEETLSDLVEQISASVWFVSTTDEVGQPRAGSAFVVTSDSERSYLLTSLAVVKASTTQPGPAIRVRKGDEELQGTLWTWDEGRDMALLVIEKPELPRLKWAPEDPPLGLAQRVFAVSGIGGAGAGIAQGFVADVSSSGVQHSTAVSGNFEGGPLINSKGEVVGMATSTYAPLGFPSDDATFAPPIRAACESVLQCGGGDQEPAGRR